jgi:hypothetical protein
VAAADEIVVTYGYRDQSGQLLFEVVRRTGKRFQQRRPDGNGGWIWNLQGIERVPYRLDKLVDAWFKQPIWVVEGEKDAEMLVRLGFVATCNPGGAGKWRPDYDKWFIGQHVVIVADNDDPGRAHADQVVKSLLPIAASVRIVDDLPVPEKGDVSDLVEAMGEAEARDFLLEMADIEPAEQPVIVSSNGHNKHHRWTAGELLTTTFPEPRWVVSDLLPEGLTMLAGRPKRGKSWLSLQLAIAVTSGGSFLDKHLDKGTALVFALEDSPRRVKERLGALRCPGGGLHVEFEIPPLMKGGLDYIIKCIEEIDPALVVLDTLARTLKGSTDQNAVGEMSDVLGPLQRLALDRRFSFMVIDHLGKTSTNDITSDILGSTAKGAVGDTLWGIYRKPGETKATLQIVGRDVEGAELVVQFQPLPLGWQLLGSASEIERSEAERDYLAALDELGEADAAQVGEELSISREAAGKMLRKLADGKKIERRRVIKNGKNRAVYRLPSEKVVPQVPPVPQGDTQWWADD